MWAEAIIAICAAILGYASGYAVGTNEAYSSVRADLKSLVDDEYMRKCEVNDMLQEMDKTRKDEV